MMQISFDLISDLHVETWPNPFDWTGMSTSIVAVVAGDISRDRDLAVKTLEHLCDCYKTVLYIDGNDEHRWTLDDLYQSEKTFKEKINHIENLIYLKNNVAVVDGVAFVGVNGWWTYDLDDIDLYNDTKEWFIKRYKINKSDADQIEERAYIDVKYLSQTVDKLQTHPEVKEIVVVSHTVPAVDLINHDPELQNTHMLNCSGNRHLTRALHNDTAAKISTWCFGHYHNDVDTILHGIRFVNNCRGRGQTQWSKPIYFPKKITIEF